MHEKKNLGNYIPSWNENGFKNYRYTDNNNHLLLESNSEKIVLALIHKSANTLIKRIFYKQLNMKYKEYEGPIERLDKLKEKCSIKNIEKKKLQSLDFAFTYRDPIERFKSTFVDKLIFKRGNTNINDSLKEYGYDPLNISFSQFVLFAELSNSALSGDMHLRQQRTFLIKRHYKYAINLDFLEECLHMIPALRLFKKNIEKKENSIHLRYNIAKPNKLITHDLVFKSNKYLYKWIQRNGSKALVESLDYEPINNKLRKIYVDDYHMLEKLAQNTHKQIEEK